MQVYDESTSRRARARVRVNWSRELSFSSRQINFICECVPDVRGVYCVYAKHDLFPYSSPLWPAQRWSSRIYVGSGWLRERLARHLSRRENDVLSGFTDDYHLVYRFAPIVDGDEDWPRITEASLLHLFYAQFGKLPPANRRREPTPTLDLHVLHVDESDNFRLAARGK